MMQQSSQKRRLQIGLFWCALMLIFSVSGVTAHAADLNLNVKSAVAVDATTGQVLYQKNANKALPIASMTKLLSIYIVLQQIHSGKLHWNQQVKVSPQIAKMSQNTELTNVPLSSSRTYSVRELYDATLIYSANAAISALGNAVSGSPHQFIKKMRATAEELNLNSAKLITASGITNGQAASLGYSSLASTDENTMSAVDVAKLAKDLLAMYPQILKTTSRATMWFDKGGSSQTEMTNWNLMLRGLSQYRSTLSVDGLKTGTSNAAGGNFVGTVNKQGHRIITVVMHASNQSTGDPARFVQTRHLMNWVYATYRPVTLNSKTYQVKNINVPMGKTTQTNATVAEPTTIWLTKSQQTSQIKGHVTINSVYSEKKQAGLAAPLTAGTVFGTATLTVNGQSLPQLGQTASLTVPIKTTTQVQRANWIVRTWRHLLAMI